MVENTLFQDERRVNTDKTVSNTPKHIKNASETVYFFLSWVSKLNAETEQQHGGTRTKVSDNYREGEKQHRQNRVDT